MTSSQNAFPPLAALPANRLIQRLPGGGYDVDASAQRLMDALDPGAGMAGTATGRILLNLQRVDARDGQLLGVSQTLEIEAEGLDDQVGLKAGLLPLLDTLEQLVGELPVGQRLEVLVGAGEREADASLTPRVRLGR